MRQQLPHTTRRSTCVVLISKSEVGCPREKSCLQFKGQLFWEISQLPHGPSRWPPCFVPQWPAQPSLTEVPSLWQLFHWSVSQTRWLLMDISLGQRQDCLRHVYITLPVQSGSYRKPSKWCLTELMNYVKRSHFQEITDHRMSYNGRFEIWTLTIYIYFEFIHK